MTCEDRGRSRIGRRVRAALAAAAASLGAVELPKTPLIVAGAVGGPLCILGLTPLRNALVLASHDTESSVLEVYQRTFAGGLASGWVGGLQAMPSACPQFVIMGPAFHLFKAAFGSVVPAVFLSGACETMFSYAAQSRNAQMAFNQDQELVGKDERVALSNPVLPWGPGVLVHVSRNILAMSGIRVLSAPLQAGIGRTFHGALPDQLVTTVGDFMASMVVAFLTMPLNQLYNFLAVSPVYQSLSQTEQVAYALQFLSDSYLLHREDGSVAGFRPQVYRDAFLRMAYIATLFALFGCAERSCVSIWRRPASKQEARRA